MEFKEIVSIAGIGGLKKIVKQRPDGLIVCDLDGSGKKFMSNRIHMFSPLENISIYTQNDSEALASVLWKMKQLSAEVPPVSAKAGVEELKEYMARVLPEYDREQVHVSDIKKLVKWYQILDEHNLITDPATAQDNKAEEAAEDAEEPGSESDSGLDAASDTEEGRAEL